MSLNIFPFVLGSLENNTYLIAASETQEAAVIDPAFNSQKVLDEVHRRNLKLSQIWITHAHFDHIAGTSLMAASIEPAVPIYLHPGDLTLYRQGGGAADFGFHLGTLPSPSNMLHDGQELKLGESILEVRHTPGHSPGHVVFYSKKDGIVFCGDLIFKNGIGRTDFLGGSYEVLMNSIRTQIFTLPPATRLLPGHGPETNVADEASINPFLV